MDKITEQYVKARNKGYAGTARDFRQTMKSQSGRDQMYNTLNKLGATDLSREQWNASFAPTAAKTQVSPSSKLGTTPSSTTAQQSAWNNPTTQDRIRILQQIHAPLNDFNESSKERAAQLQRVGEHLTPEGRKKQKALELEARLAGARTKVLGLTAPPTATKDNEAQGSNDEDDVAPIPNEQSPVPYGVKYIDGKPVTNWLLPDGSLTTDITEADQAEYTARTNRLASEATKSVDNRLRHAKEQLEELKRKHDERKSQVDKEWTEEVEKHPIISAIADEQGNGYWKYQILDTENASWREAIHEKEDQIKALEEERDRQADKSVGSWRAIKRKLLDSRLWDGGSQNLSGAMAKQRASKAKHRTEAEEALMKAIYENQEVEDLYGDNASFWYRAGAIVGESIPFMVDFVLSGGGGKAINIGTKVAAKTAAKIATKEVLKRMTEYGIKQYARKAVVKAGVWTIKALGTTADELFIRAPLMANTIQANKTAADIINRKLGNVVVDENGNYDFSNDKTWGSAIWQGEANAIIENYSEMFGSHLEKALPMLAKTFGGKRISGMLARANASDFGRILNTTKKYFQYLGISDYVGEVAEEYYGQLWRTMLNLDDAYTYVPVYDAQGNPMVDENGNPITERKNLLFTGQFNADIWGGMALSMGLMGAAKYGVSGAAYAKMKHDVNKASQTASQVFGQDEWKPLRETIDNTTNEDMGEMMETFLSDPNLSETERAAAMTYMERTLNLRGANLASVAQSRGEGAQADETGNPADNRSEAFNRGYNATEQEQHDIVAEFENADPNSENYTELQNAYNGVVQHINDNATAITEQQREIDQKTRHSDGSIRPATLTETNDDGANRFVYIVEGNAQSAQDGSVDLENSDNSVVVYDPNTGERRMVAPDAILSFEEPTSSEDYEARLESKRQENVAAQLEYLRGSQENQQQGQPTDQQQSQPVDEQSPTEQATSGTIEGTPSQFVDGMGLTVRTGQGDVPAMVMSVGRVEDGQFIPDANGSTVELMMDGEVKYIDAEKLSPSIVSYQNPQATNTDAQQQEQTTADNASNTTEQQTQQQTSAANMQVGDTFQVTDDAGNPTTARVIEVNADGIVVDFDTPVGGQSVAMLTPEQVDSIRLTEQTNNQAHQDGKEPTNVSEQEKPQESTDTPKQETQTEQTQPTQEGQKPTDRQSQPVAEQTITEQGGAADETTKEDNRPIAEDVIGDLQQKYGDNAQHKVEQTHKAATVKAEKARKAVEKAQKAYDDAPIGDEEVKAENALKKAQAAYEKAKAEERYWAEVEHRMNNANGKDAANIKAGAEVEIKTPNGVARAKVIGVDPKTGVVRYTYNKPTAEGQGVQYGEASMGEMQQMMLDAKLDANGGAVMRTRPQQSQRQKVTNSEQRQNRTAPSEVTETRQEQTEAKEEAKQEENPEESNEREEKPNESTEETEDTTEETAEPKEGESTEEERDQEQATEEEREHERGREAAIAKIGAEKVKLIEKIAKAVGAKVVWHETMDANGYYLNGAIHIAADAESLQGAENAIESVFGHESTHLIREMGTEPYQQLRDAVKDMMGEEAWNELVEKKKKLYADAGFEENDDYYEEEAVADMVGKLLSDEASLTELSGKLNRTLLDKIIDTLRKILNAFRGKKDVGELSEYQQKIQNAINTIERAFVTAQEIANYFGMTSETENGTTRGARFSVTAQAEGLGMEMVKDDGNGNVGLKAPDGTIYNVDNPLTVEAVKAMKDSSMNFMLADAREISGLTKERENQIWEKYVALMNTYLVEGRKEVGGWERVASNWQWIAESVYKTVSTNGDKQYGYSLDITRICKKNEAVINSISEMQRRVGYGITPGQIMEIYYESYKQGYQVPCPVCYVFSRYIRNGQFASVMINGQRKYGQYLTDPSKLSEGQKAERIKFWEAELEKVTAENKKNKAAITSAKRDITETLVLVDRLSLELGKKGITEARRKEIEAQVYALDARYRAALNVVSQASLDSWIKCFAIEQSNSRPTTLREDSWQGFPENMALDLRETATVVMTYPAIQRYRNTRGAAAGKGLAWAANNDIGDVPMMVGSSSAVKDLPRAEERSEEERQAIIDNEEYGKLKLGARNLYYKAAHAKTRAERAVYLEAARKRFKSAHVYAQQQSLRGGQRHWSWSDNIERLSPDVFINIMQMELLGGAMQAYSKQLEGIQLASAMGAYVNGSLMGKGKGYSEVDEKDLAFTESGQAYVKGRDFTFKGENGDVVTMKAAAWKDPKDGKYYTLEFDPVVGVDPFGSEGKEGLFHLNAKYDKAGNILVCMNDIHCRTAMADQRIHFIIPWHASGANNHILNQMYNVLNVEFDRSTDATDYTMVQEEKKFNANGNKRIHPDLLSFWEDHYDNPRQYGNAGEYSGKSFRCGIKGGIESSDGHQHLSKGQLHYRELHDAVLVGIDMPVFDKDGNPVLNSSGRQKTVQTDVREANPEWYREIMADEFLSQAYRKIHETVETGFMSDFDKEFIYPYEYWDETSTFDTADVNTPRYLEYCRRLGYKPKFIGGKRTYVSERMTAENGDGVKASKAEIAAMRDAGNFCEDMGYWKLLIDRRMYDTKGKFQDLTPVSVEGFETDMVNPDKNAEQFDVTRVADEEASKRIVDQVIANEKKNLPGGQLTVDYDLTLDEALKTYKQTVADTPRGAIPKKYSLREGETALALANRITNDRKSAAAMEQMGLSQSEVALRDALVDNLRTSGIDVITDVEQGQRVLDMVNGENDFRMEANHSEKSEAARKREETNNMIDWAVSFVSGKSMQQARAERHAREDARRKEAKEIYDAVLRKDFNPITLQRINDYIDNATPQNPYGRRISQRVPQRMERSLHAGERTNAIEALFSRICEGAVAPSRRSSKEGRREIEKAKEESLKAWAQATGNWHTDIADFTHNTTPIANTGTDSRQVYLSNDGKSVIKVSYGKGTGKKFSPDIDAINLFNHVFPNSAYKVLGYGEMNGEFVKFLEQPFVDMGSAVPLSVEERVEYMGKLGFKPINKENTAFSNGEIVAADVQKSNIVKSTDGNIRVIDADVKLHTKDFGGKYTYLAVEEDTRQRFGNVREHRVFHGSAADFDRFDHSHMGEGEGAQAYGWGTYVTDVEGVGRGYAKQSAAGVKYSLRDKATPKEVANWVADYDKANDSELGRFTQFLERGKKLRENESSQFKIGKAGDLLQSNGITGNIYVSTNAVNERMHTNDADHNIPARTWVDIADTMNEPLAIASYGDSGRGYRIYTSARVNGKTVAVGMDVNRTGEISNITTAYGRDLSKGLRNDNIVYKNDAKIKQMTNEFSPDPNRQVYHQSSVTDANIDNNSETTKSRYSLRENESALDLARRITEQADSKRLRYALRNAPAPNYQKAMIRDQYDRLITKGAYQAREAIQDSMLSLRRAMEMIIKAERKNGKANAGVKYIEDVDGFENAYLGENRLSSVNKAEIDYVSRFLFTPMVKEVAKLAKTKEERAQLIDYMMAKHGLERNEVLARRDAKEAHEKANNKYHPVGQLKSEDEYYNEFRKRDYSGLLALTRGVDANVENLLTRVDALEEQIRQAQFDGNVNLERSLKKQYKKAMEDAVQYAEKAAARMVNDYESNHQTDDLWNSVHAVSDYTLRKQLETGMISKDLYDQVRKMFEHYIPLRGFDETTTSDEYTYLSSGRGATNTKIRKAAGRISKADDPFASLESMMESTIMEGNRNQLVKQRFLNFVKRHPSDLISVDDLWLEYDAASGEWRPRFCNTIRPNDSAADVERKIRDFNNNMEAAANAQPDIYRRASDNPNIRYRVVGDMKAREHQVIVRRGGKDIVLTINGNPRLAQALNGMTNPDNDLTGAVGKAVEVAMGVNRYLSAMYTTMNPDFVLSNFCRDMFYSATSVPAKENAHYAVTFWGNLAKCNPVNLMRLYERYNAGKLANPQTEIEKHFVEFLRNGGETGFIQARTQEKVKQEIAKMLRNRGQKIPLNQVLGIIGEQYEMANRAVENAARFAVFVTSRAEGRTLDRSIYDAKEVSVNFNKKGAGFKMYDAVEQKNLGKAAAFMSGMGRTTYLFWNASVQGSTNYLRMVRRHPAKALAVGTGLFAMGMLSSLAGALIGGDDDKKKDSYFDTPEATRRANIMFRAGDGFVKVPLPVEYRVFYGMGELCMSTMLGQTDYSTGELAKQVTGTLTQAMPLDVLGDSQPAMVFVPDAIKPIVQGAANSNWTGLPLYKDTPWNKDDPEYTKAYKSASRGSIAVSKFVNDATGGDAHKKGWGDTWLTNPGVIENLLSGYAGGAWSWVNKMVQTAEMATGQREFDPKGVILLSRVYQQGDERTANRVLNEKYYRLRDHYNKFDALLKDYKADKKAGIYDYADKITEMISQPEYKKMKGFKALNKKIKDVTKKMNTAPTPKKAEEYEAELKRLKQQAIEQYSVNK